MTEVLIVATRHCTHYPKLSEILRQRGIEHRVVFAEEEPELTERLAIRHSPTLVVDGEVLFRGFPNEEELHTALNRIAAS